MLTVSDKLIQNNPLLLEGIRDAQILLSHAAKSGKELSPDIVQSLVDIGVAASTRKIDAIEEARFWVDRNRLSRELAPVSIESVNAITVLEPARRFIGSCTRARFAEHRYRNYAIGVLIVLLIMQVYWIVGTSVVAEIKRTDAELFAASEKLALRKVSKQAAMAGKEGAVDDGAIADDSTLLGRVATLELRQLATYELLKTWAKPFSFAVHGLDATDPEGTVRANAARLQISLMVLDILQRYFLSLLYGSLGACVFVLRSLSDEIRGWTYCMNSDIRFRSRLHLGALGGMVIAWFVTGDTSSGLLQSLSPFALAFVAGYGVELLFTAMDKIISAFTSPPTPPVVAK